MSAPNGVHLLVDYDGIDARLLDDEAALLDLAHRAAEAAGARVVGHAFYCFEGGGVSLVLLLAESHLSIHTWPRLGRAAIDVYTCGDARPERAHETFVAALRPKAHQLVTVKRPAT